MKMDIFFLKSGGRWENKVPVNSEFPDYSFSLILILRTSSFQNNKN